MPLPLRQRRGFSVDHAEQVVETSGLDDGLAAMSAVWCLAQQPRDNGGVDAEVEEIVLAEIVRHGTPPHIPIRDSSAAARSLAR
jgi:hypothetical protein